MVRCLWCRSAVPLSIAAKHQGVCPLCLAEIAERVGYESEYAFNRAFKRQVGRPPAAWRKKTSALQEAL